MTLTLANMAVGTLLGLVAARMIALYFGNHNFGQVQFALNALGLLFFITDLGMGAAHVKRVSEGRDPGDCFATFAVFKVVATATFATLVVAFLVVFVGILGKPLEDTTLTIVLVVLVYYVAKSLQEVGQSSFDARLETARSQLAAFTDTLVRTGLTILGALLVAALVHKTGPFLARVDPEQPVFAWMRDQPGAVLAIATAAGGVAAALMALAMLRRSLERGRFRRELLRDYASFALPLFLSSAIGMIALNVDGAVLGYFLSADQVGLFGQAKRLPLVIAGIGTALSTLLFPTLSALAARGDRDGIQRSMDKALRYLSMVMLPVLAFAAVFSADLIRILLSDEVVPGARAMAILCGYVVLVTLAIPHSNLLFGLERPDVPAKLGIVSAIVLIGLNLLLVPTDIRSLGLTLGGLGVEGAALATLASGLVWYASLRVATARIAGYREHAHIWRHLAAAAIMAAALLGLDATVLPLERWFHVPLFGLLGLAVYALALVAVRELGAEDWRLLRASVHPVDMLRYVRDEIRHKRR